MAEHHLYSLCSKAKVWSLLVHIAVCPWFAVVGCIGLGCGKRSLKWVGLQFQRFGEGDEELKGSWVVSCSKAR
jgi:hypothetical protein